MLRAAVARAIWRLLRATQRRADPAPGFAGVDRYTVFAGTVVIAGSMPADRRVVALTYCLPGGERLPVRFAATPDGIRFDARLSVSATPLETASAWLTATFEDGAELQQYRLGEAADASTSLGVEFQALLSAAPPGRMLEVGARARSGVVRRGWAPATWEYSGFDIRPGPNVDVVGDAHALSRHYPSESFDAVMALSVLEHLLMPWKFVVELNRVLKPGAIGFFQTHQTWPLHDQPWDFWRYSDTAWTGLLNKATGFEIIAARLGEPAAIVARNCSPLTAFPDSSGGALASVVLFRKIGPTTLEWPVELTDILHTDYPDGETTVMTGGQTQ